MLQFGTEHVDIRASYLHDTLAQLTSAALHLARQDSSQEDVLFMDEPGAWPFELKRNGGLLSATLTRFDDQMSRDSFGDNKHTARERLIFEVLAEKFTMEVLNVFFKLDKQHGLAGYKA